MSVPPPPQPQRLKSLISMGAIYVYDVLAAAAAMGFAVETRYIFEDKPPPDFITLKAMGIFALACAVTFALFRLHKGVWRYTAANDAVRVLQAILVANFIFFPVLFLINRLEGLPRTSILIEIPVLALLMIAPRAIAAAWRTGELRSIFRFENRKTEPALLIGTEDAVSAALRDLNRRNGEAAFRVKGLIELSGGHAGRAIGGIPVLGGIDALEGALKRLNRAESQPVRLVIADTRLSPALMRTLVRVAGRTGARLSRARPAGGGFSPIEAADLLNRPPRAPALDGARRLIAGRRVLITGAGGTIGSELVRAAAALGPEKLVLYDAAESSLYEIDMAMAQMPGAPPWRPVLGDIRDTVRLNGVFAEERPQIVLHAAALKHVPLNESNPCEAVMTNLWGTMQTFEAARAAGAELVALISTDKAVDPVSVMGATKRAAEIYARASAQTSNGTRVCVVRFGNVLGSTGSVVPLFEKQIERGLPVTVTDADATRFFMTAEEACALVLEAAALTHAATTHDGALYVFDMGDPISIRQLARSLIRLRGRDPDAPDAIRFTGLRPGERLHEALVYDFESLTDTAVDGVLTVEGPRPDPALVEPLIEALLDAARQGDDEAVRARLQALAPEYRPENGAGGGAL